jgi:uncharacterized membrane protein YphA (DoxX/SURF4 family)
MMTFKKFLHNDYLGLIVRLAVGIMFIYASYDKILAPAQFARIVYNYHLLPGELINLAAIVMPWVEFMCGLTLILGIYKQGSIVILNAMMLIFMVAITVNIFRGVDLECGCFTVSSKAKSNALFLLLEDFGFLALTLYLFFNRSQRFDLLKTK